MSHGFYLLLTLYRILKKKRKDGVGPTLGIILAASLIPLGLSI
jgi:hypothetical protein